MQKRITNPYENTSHQTWYRGNLHAHTTRSDGHQHPQDVVDAYAAAGYDFLMISDHDIFTSEQDLAMLSSRGMSLIPGNEVTADGPHILHVNGTTRVAPATDRAHVLAAIHDDQGFAIINHPNWLPDFNQCSIEELRSWPDYVGIEIYNHVVSWLSGSPYALDKWDMMLSEGRRIWGFAADDSHAADHIGKVWTVVSSPSKSVSDLVAALRQGSFYSSTGVVIRSIQIEDDLIRIDTENAQKIVGIRKHGQRFIEVSGSSIEVRLPENTDYVRFECWGSGESFAWTQPFFATSAQS